MGRFAKITVFVLAATFLVSCGAARKISVVSLEELTIYGLSSVHAEAVVRNDSGRSVAVENAVIDFAYKQRRLATARLILPVEVPAGSVSPVRIDMKLEAASLSDLQTLQNRIEINPSQVTVSIKARVRYGKWHRTVEMDDIPYSEIFAKFGQFATE